jgi:DHA3 family macrolide efflux protein-like MFS transporter
MGRTCFYVFSACFLVEFGRAMYFLVISWVLYELTKSPAYTGLLVGLGFVPGLFLNLVIGVIVDRFHRKGLILSANLLIIAVMISVTIAIGAGVAKPWLIIGTHMLLQVTGSLYRPALQAFLPEAFAKEELPKIFTRAGAASDLGALLGSSLSGTVMAYFSAASSMAAVICCFLLGTVALMPVKHKTALDRGHKKTTAVSDLVSGFTYLRNNTFLLGLFTIMFVGQLVLHTSAAFLPVYVKDFLNSSVQIYGIMAATISIGGIVAGILGTWWWKRSGRSVATRSLLLVAAGLLCVGLSPSLPVSFVGVFLIGAGTTWIRVLLQTVQQMATDPQYHGRMASYRMLCNQSAVAIGGPILGWIASHCGVESSYLALLLPVTGATLFSLFQRKAAGMNIPHTPT